MPRYSDMTVEEVLAAIRKLREAGEKETMVSVQQTVGRGTLGVIRRYMILAYAQMAEAGEDAPSSMPPAVKASSLSKRAARRERNSKALIEIERRERLIELLSKKNAELLEELAAALQRERELLERFERLSKAP